MNVQFTFMMSYIILLTTGTICFIEALRTNSPMIRHIFNLETCISIVAGYFYYLFVEKIKEYERKQQKIDWLEMTKLRYMDWSITTPMMLIVLCAALAYNIKKTVSVGVISIVIILNYIMLYAGYLGEDKTLEKCTASAIGFGAFFLMFLVVFYQFIKPKYSLPNYVFYTLYFITWTAYGIVYFFEEETKNIYLNVLDVISKCFVGLVLWFYYTKIIV
jgi:bacteriorhodopsin